MKKWVAPALAMGLIANGCTGQPEPRNAFSFEMSSSAINVEDGYVRHYPEEPDVLWTALTPQNVDLLSGLELYDGLGNGADCEMSYSVDSATLDAVASVEIEGLEITFRQGDTVGSVGASEGFGRLIQEGKQAVFNGVHGYNYPEVALYETEGGYIEISSDTQALIGGSIETAPLLITSASYVSKPDATGRFVLASASFGPEIVDDLSRPNTNAFYTFEAECSASL